jgi:AcrR family transcriptional regulator
VFFNQLVESLAAGLLLSTNRLKNDRARLTSFLESATLKGVNCCRYLPTRTRTVTATPIKLKRTPAKPPKRSQSLKSAERRSEIVRAAYRTLAEKGFEGLRMRDIAKRAGIDHSTLHYYFAGKEALIDAIVDYIVLDLAVGRSPAAESEEVSPRLRLSAHFEALIEQLQKTPEMFVVLAELNTRAMREPSLRVIFNKNDRKWKGFLTEVLVSGMDKNEFKGTFLPDVAAEVIISVVRGLTITCAGRAERMRRPLYQVLAWLEGTS